MIKKLGLKSDGGRTKEQKLQSYAMLEVEKFLKGKNRRVIAWEEILDGGSPIILL